MKPVDARSSLVKKLIIKIRNLKLVTMLEYQNIKIILQKGYVPNESEKIFVVKKVVKTV